MTSAAARLVSFSQFLLLHCGFQHKVSVLSLLNENGGEERRAERSPLATLKGKGEVCPRTQHTFLWRVSWWVFWVCSRAVRAWTAPCSPPRRCRHGQYTDDECGCVQRKLYGIYGIGLTFTYFSYVIKYSSGFFFFFSHLEIQNVLLVHRPYKNKCRAMIHHPLVCAVLTVRHKWLLNQCSPAKDRATLSSHVAYDAESGIWVQPLPWCFPAVTWGKSRDSRVSGCSFVK